MPACDATPPGAGEPEPSQLDDELQTTSKKKKDAAVKKDAQIVSRDRARSDLTIPDRGVDASSAPFHLRVVAANLTSGNKQSYSGGEGLHILQGVQPDLVLIQEFNYGDNSAAAVQQMVTTTFGAEFSYHRESGVQIPNGVISRFPILEAGTWDDSKVSNRSFVWARLDVPGERDLWAVSLHLLTTSSTNRNIEAKQLVQYIQSKVPASDFLVLGGDLNTGSRGENCISTLAAVVETSGPYPADASGNEKTNEPRKKILDWVLFDADLQPFTVPVQIGQNVFPGGLVVDTRVYQPLADIAPAQYSDSAAENMQHMAVVRDFVVSP